MEETFDEYYENVVYALKRLGETQRPDPDTVRVDYQDGITPERSAKAFFEEWN